MYEFWFRNNKSILIIDYEWWWFFTKNIVILRYSYNSFQGLTHFLNFAAVKKSRDIIRETIKREYVNFVVEPIANTL